MISHIRSTALHIAAPLALLSAVAACGGSDTPAADTTATQMIPAPDSAPAAGAAVAEGAMLDPNTATRDELLAVPGMNAAAADALIAGRPYDHMVAANAALSPVLDEEARRTVYARLWKPIDLNSATQEEILLIPGVGQRMLREFEEYRPYTSMEQFRREIGKYVDDEELARLEQYVMIR